MESTAVFASTHPPKRGAHSTNTARIPWYNHQGGLNPFVYFCEEESDSLHSEARTVETTESDSPLRPNPPYPEARMVKSPDWVFRKDIGIESVNTVELLTCKLDATVFDSEEK